MSAGPNEPTPVAIPVASESFQGNGAYDSFQGAAYGNNSLQPESYQYPSQQMPYEVKAGDYLVNPPVNPPVSDPPVFVDPPVSGSLASDLVMVAMAIPVPAPQLKNSFEQLKDVAQIEFDAQVDAGKTYETKKFEKLAQMDFVKSKIVDVVFFCISFGGFSCNAATCGIVWVVNFSLALSKWLLLRKKRSPFERLKAKSLPDRPAPIPNPPLPQLYTKTERKVWVFEYKGVGYLVPEHPDPSKTVSVDGVIINEAQLAELFTLNVETLKKAGMLAGPAPALSSPIAWQTQCLADRNAFDLQYAPMVAKYQVECARILAENQRAEQDWRGRCELVEDQYAHYFADWRMRKIEYDDGLNSWNRKKQVLYWILYLLHLIATIVGFSVSTNCSVGNQGAPGGLCALGVLCSLSTMFFAEFRATREITRQIKFLTKTQLLEQHQSSQQLIPVHTNVQRDTADDSLRPFFQSLYSKALCWTVGFSVQFRGVREFKRIAEETAPR